MFNLDDVIQSTVEVESDFGRAGLQLKELVEPKTSKLFVIPFGSAEYEPNYTAEMKYTGADCKPYRIGTFWMSTEQLNDSAVDSMNIGDKQTMISRVFIAPKHCDNTWYGDLGYAEDRKEETANIEAGRLTSDSWKRVYPHLTFYPGNSVFPTAWHNLPLIEVKAERIGGVMTYTPVSKVWLRLKRNQMIDFMAAVAGLKLSDDPTVQWNVIEIANSGVGMSRYSFSLGGKKLPEDQRDEFSGLVDEISDYVMQLFTSIKNNQHKGDPYNQDNVREYFLSITRFNTWEEFVEANSILANPLQKSDLVEVGALELDDTPPF